MFVEVEVDAPGQWAFHCHILTHMEAGMFRVVEVGDHVVDDAEPPPDDFEAGA